MGGKGRKWMTTTLIEVKGVAEVEEKVAEAKQRLDGGDDAIKVLCGERVYI